MNNKALTLSLVMAVLAVFFVQSYVTSIEEEARKKFGTEVLVVAAAKDIREMATIDETMLELKRVPKRFLEPAAVSFEEGGEEGAARDMKRLAGSVAIVPIKEGEQLTFNKLTEPSLRTGLAPQVTPGRRAVAVPVNEVTGISKLVKPGDRVDVIAIVSTADRNDPKVAKTILQDVAVLSVGRNVTNNVARQLEQDSLTGAERVRSLTTNDAFSSVTLEVEPAQAQALALIVAGGDATIALSLRNNDDSDRVGVSNMKLSDVLGSSFVGGGARGPASPRPGGR